MNIRIQACALSNQAGHRSGVYRRSQTNLGRWHRFQQRADRESTCATTAWVSFLIPTFCSLFANIWGESLVNDKRRTYFPKSGHITISWFTFIATSLTRWLPRCPTIRQDLWLTFAATKRPPRFLRRNWMTIPG